jgi:hypothetical protein
MNISDATEASIQDFIKQKHDNYQPNNLRFEFSLNLGVHNRYICIALSQCDFEEKAKIIIGLADLLTNLFQNPESNNASSNLHKIIGFDTPIDFKSAPYFTLSPDEQQLRCWYGPHLAVMTQHVESNGHNLFFNISIDRETSKKLVDIIQNKYKVEQFIRKDFQSKDWVKQK